MSAPALPWWTCQGFRAVRAESADAAARVFARRHARKDYGGRGLAGGVRLEGCTFDHRDYTFQAFIGRRNGRNTLEGHNVWLFIHRVGAPQGADATPPPD